MCVCGCDKLQLSHAHTVTCTLSCVLMCVVSGQVVRTDLKELLEIPLHGAPYGYTPFCDSRPEMEGFK